MVSVGLRLVSGSWKMNPISLPRSLRMPSVLSFRTSIPSNRISPATILPGGSGDEPGDRQRGHALAAAGLADQPERLAVADVEADVVDGLDDAVRA